MVVAASVHVPAILHPRRVSAAIAITAVDLCHLYHPVTIHNDIQLLGAVSMPRIVGAAGMHLEKGLANEAEP